MKYLADHFFFDDEFAISQSLAKRALQFCARLERPDNCEYPNFRLDIKMLQSDLNFILGKVEHKKENYDEALTFYYESLKDNKNNHAANFNLSKILFLTGNYQAVDESLNQILSVPIYKDSFEAIHLLAKTKCLQGKIYEALALYKRVMDLNPRDYKASFEVAQMFDTVDQVMALTYYE